jgi:uncharacterized membrane protein HdeD (DUF308 family)
MSESRSAGGPAGPDRPGENVGVSPGEPPEAGRTGVPPQRSGYPAQAADSQPGLGGEAAAGLARIARLGWTAVLIAAVAMVALGVLVLVWPSESLRVLAILVGLALVASGLVRLFEGFTARAESGGMRVAYVVIGLIAIVAGVYCLRHHALTLLAVAFVVGVYWIVHGVADLGVAMSAPRGTEGRGLRTASGLLSLAAGIIVVIWPAETLAILILILGAWLLCYGVLLVALAFRLRRAVRAVT